MLRTVARRAGAPLFAAFVCLGVAGCGGSQREVRLATAFAAPSTPYGALLPRYTRSAELYEGFDTVAKAWVTWRAPELRAALAETAVAAYGLRGEDAAVVRRDEERAARRVREFHVALFTGKPGWGELESPDTLWRISLDLPSGERLTPIQVVRLAKTDRSAVEYPYVTRWTREYSVFFPNVPPPEADTGATLTLSGPLGTMTFVFGAPAASVRDPDVDSREAAKR